MPDIKIPTLDEFKSLTGRSGLGRIFKTKNDLDAIFRALSVFHGIPPMSSQSSGAIRAVRRACIAWLSTAGNDAQHRDSHTAVSDLLTRANAHFVALAEAQHHGEQASSATPVAIKPVPNLPFGRDITARSGQATDVKRIGNQLNAGLSDETKSRHWGPHVAGRMNQQYGNYQAAGGLLSIGAWADHIFLVNAEDDPTGLYVGGPSVTPVQAREVREGVKYCSEAERASYVIDIQGGRLYDASGALYDTAARETHFSGHGWAIFVLGFDNRLYSNTHLVNIFHHSSFFAGEPVQCGGEICCIAGKVRYLTNKTGHYRSGNKEFYRFLSFLHYHGVDLRNALAGPGVTQGNNDWFRASDVFAANGKAPTNVSAVTSGKPPKLNAPGVPNWPVPPMLA